MEDLPHEFLIENSSINAEFLNNRTGEITAGGYLVSITEIMSDCQQIDRGALLIINNYIFFYLGFLSQPFTNYRTAVEEGGHFFNSSLTLLPASQTLRH